MRRDKLRRHDKFVHTWCADHDAEFVTRGAQIEIAGLIALLCQSYIDFWIILALLMTNATLGFVEEMNAQVCALPRAV